MVDVYAGTPGDALSRAAWGWELGRGHLKKVGWELRWTGSHCGATEEV